MHPMQTILIMGSKQSDKSPVVSHAEHNHAAQLLQVFTDQTTETKRMALVYRMAIGDDRLTIGQLKDVLTRASEMADNADKMNGFKPVSEAKGSEKYGPKRASLNTVASTIRQVWGALVFTHVAMDADDDGQPREPMLTPSMGFAKAIGVARKALKDNSIKWDGSRDHKPEEKKTIKDASAYAALEAQYRIDHPNMPEEKQAEAVELLWIEQENKKLDDLAVESCDTLIKRLGLERAADVAEKIIERWNDLCELEQAKSSECVSTGETPAHEEDQTEDIGQVNGYVSQ